VFRKRLKLSVQFITQWVPGSWAGQQQWNTDDRTCWETWDPTRWWRLAEGTWL